MYPGAAPAPDPRQAPGFTTAPDPRQAPGFTTAPDPRPVPSFAPVPEVRPVSVPLSDPVSGQAPVMPRFTEQRKKSGNGKLALLSVARVFVIFLIAASLVIGIAVTAGFFKNQFSAEDPELAEKTLSYDAGAVSVTVGFSPKELSTLSNAPSSVRVQVKNTSDSILSDIGLDIELPSGISFADGGGSLSVERLGPGASRAFNLNVKTAGSYDRSVKSSAAVIAAVGAIVVVLLIFLAVLGSRRRKLAGQILSVVLALELVLPMTVTAIKAAESE